MNLLKCCDMTSRHTIVFLDEIHRFSRSHQVCAPYFSFVVSLTIFQDAFIPFIERGFVQVSIYSIQAVTATGVKIIGATTENPSFELNRALLHLCR